MEGSTTGLASITTSLNTMISDVATQATSIITTNVPIVAAVVGGMILVRFGMKFAKQVKNG